MEASKIFNDFATDLKTTFSISIAEIDVDETAKHIEKNFFPQVLKIIQKDDTFFAEERSVFAVNLSSLWSSSELSDKTKDAIWKHIQLCMLASFMHGDIKDKMSSVMDMFKGVFAGKNDEISKILEDENSQGHFKEILEFVMETKLAKMCMKMAEELDMSDFDIDIENPEELIAILKNPEHPMVKKVISKVQGVIKEKIQKGAITQEEIVREIESVKAKVMGLFGNVFNDALGGTRGNIPSSAMMGNSPEARRQRMMARLQKKLREKNSR
jgi:hypothetical protein